MKSKLAGVTVVLVFLVNSMCAQEIVEQYCYLGQAEASAWVPQLHYQSPKNWYVEGRYNYEGLNAFSLYVGKAFLWEGDFSYSVTPLLGGVVGGFKGGSAGLNLSADYKGFFLSSQSQYSFCVNEENVDFLFAWSEMGYRVLDWFYFGVSTQYNYLCQTKDRWIDPGAMVGIEIGKWTFPIYGFSPKDSNPYFVVGVNFNLGIHQDK